MASELSDFERTRLQAMERLAQELPEAPDDAVEHDLDMFDTYLWQVGDYCRQPAANLLRRIAQGCVNDSRRERILRAAEAVAEGRLCSPRPAPAVTPGLHVSDFSSGLVVRVVQSFVDYDGQEIRAGEVLHFREKEYSAHADGYKLTFDEKVIRLSGDDPHHLEIIVNARHAYFEPLRDQE